MGLTIRLGTVPISSHSIFSEVAPKGKLEFLTAAFYLMPKSGWNTTPGVCLTAEPQSWIWVFFVPVLLNQENVPLMRLFSFPNKEDVFLTCPWNTPWHKQITSLMPFQLLIKWSSVINSALGKKWQRLMKTHQALHRLSWSLLCSAVMTNIFCHHSVLLISQINASYAVKLPSEI